MHYLNQDITTFDSITATTAAKGSKVLDDMKIPEKIAIYILSHIKKAYLKDRKSLSLRTSAIRSAVTMSINTGGANLAYNTFRALDMEGFHEVLTRAVAAHVTTESRKFTANFHEESVNNGFGGRQKIHFLTIHW